MQRSLLPSQGYRVAFLVTKNSLLSLTLEEAFILSVHSPSGNFWSGLAWWITPMVVCVSVVLLERLLLRLLIPLLLLLLLLQCGSRKVENVSSVEMLYTANSLFLSALGIITGRVSIGIYDISCLGFIVLVVWYSNADKAEGRTRFQFGYFLSAFFLTVLG
jgi:hypothetical protein